MPVRAIYTIALLFARMPNRPSPIAQAMAAKSPSAQTPSGPRSLTSR